jgi:uncharacterized protein YaeQ
MANQGTLYRFKIEISDIERNFYGTAEFRIQMHSSESEDYFLTRVIAYALNYDPGLQVSPGLCAGDEAAMWLSGSHGAIALWIDVGNPAPRRLNKASKASDRVRVYTYKDPGQLKKDCEGERIHRAEKIEIFSLDAAPLKQLAAGLKRDNSWNLIHNQDELMITVGDETIHATLVRHNLM